MIENEITLRKSIGKSNDWDVTLVFSGNNYSMGCNKFCIKCLRFTFEWNTEEFESEANSEQNRSFALAQAFVSVSTRRKLLTNQPSQVFEILPYHNHFERLFLTTSKRKKAQVLSLWCPCGSHRSFNLRSCVLVRRCVEFAVENGAEFVFFRGFSRETVHDVTFI